jgi:hypothetical protein
MFRAALLAAAAVFAFGAASPARADTVYYCMPDEPRATAPDRLVSVEITIKPNGEFASVVYRAANGAAYSRGQQYEATNSQDRSSGQHYWVGTLRANPDVAMVGSLYRKGDRLVYFETIYDKLHNGKVVSQVASICEPSVSEAAPRQAPAAFRSRGNSVPIYVEPGGHAVFVDVILGCSPRTCSSTRVRPASPSARASLKDCFCAARPSKHHQCKSRSRTARQGLSAISTSTPSRLATTYCATSRLM